MSSQRKRKAETNTRQDVAEAVVPDAAVPDAAVPDAAVLDAAVPAAAVLDAAVPDARTADWTLDTIPDGLPTDVDLSLGCSKCKDSSCRHCRWRRIKRMADALGYPQPNHLKNTACSKRQRIQKRPAAGCRYMEYDMEDFWVQCVERYLELAPKGTTLKSVPTPFLDEGIR